MSTVYKLTDEKGQTRNATQWGEGITHATSGDGDLCGPGWLHYYSHPILALLMNPQHAAFVNPRLWEAEAGPVQKHDLGRKSGTTQLTTVRELPVPTITTEQRVRFAIRCALAVYVEPAFVAWAQRWVSGEDRSSSAADAAYAAAAYAAYAAAAYAADKLPLGNYADWAMSGEPLPSVTLHKEPKP